MSLSLRETRQILKTVPLANLPTRTKSSRLFGLRRCVLSPSFFSNNEARSSVKTPFFSIYTSRVTKEIFDKVNGGPSWLKGAYPPGVLSGKHERYRLINYVPPRMKLSDVKQVKAVQSSDQQRAQRIAQTRLPILQADEPENDLIPVVYLATKKRTHKDAAKRNMARHKVRTALEVVVKELEGTSSEIMKGKSLAVIFCEYHHCAYLIQSCL